MEYLHWDEKTITDFSPENITDLYDRGYVFTRLGKGSIHQTRSVRVELAKFELSSENRRILKKIFDINLIRENIPYRDYSWPVAKLAKDFYSVKFGGTSSTNGNNTRAIMSAAKIKEILTRADKSNFTSLLIYVQHHAKTGITGRLGYTICYENNDILHYCYPFYELDISPKDMGLGMMIEAVEWAKKEKKKYVYLGSLQRPSDVYKLQFSGLEWFDGGPEGTGAWRTDTDVVKEILKNAHPKNTNKNYE